VLTVRRRAGTVLFAGALVASACTSQEAVPEAAPPITVAPAAAESDDGVDAVNVGIVLNTASPTAARDERLVEVMAASAAAVRAAQSVEIFVETATIADVDDAASAVRDLVNRGVTVIATSCDDSSMQTVVDAAIEEQLLAVTGCVAIPKPELNLSNRLFIDLASLDDSSAAMAAYARAKNYTSVAVLSSELIPDVEQSCLDIEQFLTDTPRSIELAARGSFVELVDDPSTLVSSLAPQLASADAIVVCALAPALGDMIEALRASGLEQPILVPWFGEPQDWAATTTNVFVLSPSSVYGDDPSMDVAELFAEIEDAEAVDVIAADTLPQNIFFG